MRCRRRGRDGSCPPSPPHKALAIFISRAIRRGGVAWRQASVAPTMTWAHDDLQRVYSFAVLLISHTQAGAPMARHSTSSISSSLPVSHRVDSFNVPIQLQQIGESILYQHTAGNFLQYTPICPFDPQCSHGIHFHPLCIAFENHLACSPRLS